MDQGSTGEDVETEKEQAAQARASWRELSINDIDSLACIAAIVHVELPESDEVFAERMRLFPEGCLGLSKTKRDNLCGYAISHPIRHRQPPALNSLLGEIASNADQYYVHDLAILSEFRGDGLAQECIRKLLSVAKRFPTTCLISVYGTTGFWRRFGFVPVQIDEIMRKKLVDYGDDATYLERKNEEYEPQ